MKMHILSGGRLRMKKSIYLPEAERSDTIDLPVSCFLLRHSQGNVLFDTGCHPSVHTDAEARWGGMAKAMVPIADPAENVVTELQRLGLTPDDIDVVVNSHFHPDHCGCNEYFTRAVVVCHQHELAAAQAPNAVSQGFLAVEWRHPMPIQTIAGEHDVFGDGRIVLIPVPGHTPGTITAVVSLDRSGAFVLASDAVALRAHIERENCPRNTWNVDLAMQSMAEIRRMESDGAKVIYGHDLAQWETLRKGAAFYE